MLSMTKDWQPRNHKEVQKVNLLNKMSLLQQRYKYLPLYLRKAAIVNTFL
jgi:hypothetical protein